MLTLHTVNSKQQVCEFIIRKYLGILNCSRTQQKLRKLIESGSEAFSFSVYIIGVWNYTVKLQQEEKQHKFTFRFPLRAFCVVQAQVKNKMFNSRIHTHCVPYRGQRPWKCIPIPPVRHGGNQRQRLEWMGSQQPNYPCNGIIRTAHLFSVPFRIGALPYFSIITHA